jgi:hypothetical protein
MGNTISKNTDSDLKKVVDFVASKYILGENFNDMRKLSDIDYCNELIILTSEILNKKLNTMEIEYLAQKTEGGVDIDKMTKDDVKFFKKKNMDQVEVTNQAKKRRMCIGIAKYYIKIAHLFAAIATTINPEFTLQKKGEKENIRRTTPSVSNQQEDTVTAMSKPRENEMYKAKDPQPPADLQKPPPDMPNFQNLPPDMPNFQNLPPDNNLQKPPPNINNLFNNPPQNNRLMVGGNQMEINNNNLNIDQNNPAKTSFNLENKSSMPVNTNFALNKFNLCSERIHSLLKNQSKDDVIEDQMSIQTNMCSLNVDKNGKTKTLDKIAGIAQLEKLYYDVYNFDTGKYDSMSNAMKKIYLEDVRRFYKVFTHSDNVPDYVNKYSDITLQEYQNNPGCRSQGGNAFRKSYTGSIKYELFDKYIKHVQSMIDKMNENQNKLIGILDRLFVTATIKGKENVTLNPEMNEKFLTDLVKQARQLIINLYIECEDDYYKGLKLFEAIANNQELETSKMRDIPNIDNDFNNNKNNDMVEA